ncbi:hypothetical protein MLD38_038789 [Melastoma candidum]|uniref:Uncharacterized protein n=1 Tax=Melastoma candidum TaxID=119954 RepID=A0ACB9L0P7_9MYRT|nr:hypothetical protein MLD38_038789 [Melastoma candidum]
MGRAAVKEGDFGVDLEAGVIGIEELGLLRDPVCGVDDKGTCRKTAGAVVTLKVKGSETGETLSSAEKAGKEKRKKSGNIKASKPPRPPRSPSLDAADQKLIKEIAELAMLKRARLERMKALKNEKNAKAASSGSSRNVLALVFTVLFIFVMVFQGCSPSTTVPVITSEGPPMAVGSVDKGVISSQHDPSQLARHENGPLYGTPTYLVELVNEGPPIQVGRRIPVT